MSSYQVETVVIGGSQSGLAVGYHLAQRGIPFVILRTRQDRGCLAEEMGLLHLFTPGRYDGLPGLLLWIAFLLPDKGRARRLSGDVRPPVRPSPKPASKSKGFPGRGSIRGGLRPRYPACRQRDRMATGAYTNPRIPPFAPELDESILQPHSKDYRTHPSYTRAGCSS